MRTIRTIFASLLLVLLTVPAMAQSVVFPQQEQAGAASVAVTEGADGSTVYTLSNNLFSASFVQADGHITFGGCDAMNLRAGTELFKLSKTAGSDINASDMTLQRVGTVHLAADSHATRGAERLEGEAIEAVFTQGDLTVTWQAILRDGSHYLRTALDIEAARDTKMYNVVPMLYDVDSGTAGSAPAVSGDTRGSVLISDKIFAGLETPTAFNTSDATNDVADFDPYTWTVGSFNWTPSELPSSLTALGYAAGKDIIGKQGYLKLRDAGKQTVTFQYTGGNLRLDIAGVDIVDPATGIVLSAQALPYGSTLYVTDKANVTKGDMIAKWDPFNAVIVTEVAGKVRFEDVEEGITYKVESDEATGLREIIIIESKDRNKIPSAHIVDEDGNILHTYNLPVGGHVVVEDAEAVKAGDVLVKIPRAQGKAGDITGGLPRVTELFEARNPSNPAIVSEIDGEVTMGKIKRGNREITVTSKTGDFRKYLISTSKQILVQENDFVRAGTPLSDGAITPADILAIKGPTAVQEYIVNEVQDVYRLQGVKINDKHFEIIVRQMMRKVQIEEAGDTRFLEDQLVDKLEFLEENDRIWGKKVVIDAGDSETMQKGQIVTARKLRDENSSLKRRDLRTVQVRDAVTATSRQVLQGITRAALHTSSFMSAASFQETTKVLNEAAINGKTDYLEGMKENVICGKLIPAGTGLREYDKIVVGSREDYDRMMAGRQTITDIDDYEPVIE